MMPGRSLSAKTSGRSCAPVASTTSPRAHLPQPLARQVRGRLRQVVGDPLAQAEMVVVVVAEGGGARQQRDVRARCERWRASRPSHVLRRRAVDGRGRCRAAARRRARPARRRGSRACRSPTPRAPPRGRPDRRRPPARRNGRGGAGSGRDRARSARGRGRPRRGWPARRPCPRRSAAT